MGEQRIDGKKTKFILNRVCGALTPLIYLSQWSSDS